MERHAWKLQRRGIQVWWDDCSYLTTPLFISHSCSSWFSQEYCVSRPAALPACHWAAAHHSLIHSTTVWIHNNNVGPVIRHRSLCLSLSMYFSSALLMKRRRRTRGRGMAHHSTFFHTWSFHQLLIGLQLPCITLTISENVFLLKINIEGRCCVRWLWGGQDGHNLNACWGLYVSFYK